ncbi:MAG TPA: lysylphosphatidylglycerol synthase domain-containing protein [Steroidobacteraceae bacterium]|jgi:putative membrane protein|nr:lysylphosphatidylglycerol synthase domain-containing protein [Steroidobacteraceae bacterium]
MDTTLHSSARARLKTRIVLVAALGLALAAYLVLHVGFAAVLSAAAEVGWGGFALLCLYALALYPLLGAAWSVLLPHTGARPRGFVWAFVWARMVREAASDVLPFSQVGGIVLGARAAIRRGIGRSEAFASTIVDVTTEALAQIGFIALGFAILSARPPRSSSAAALTRAFEIGLILSVAAGIALVLLQRYGHRVTGRLAARILPGAAASADALADALDGIYRSRPRVVLSSAMHLVGWLASGAGTWLAFRLIGIHIELASVIAIESLVGAAKNAAALVPNAFGVQEASYAALVQLFGVGPEFGLAVSLVRRARDVAIGAPILLISQADASRRAIRG